MIRKIEVALLMMIASALPLAMPSFAADSAATATAKSTSKSSRSTGSKSTGRTADNKTAAVAIEAAETPAQAAARRRWMLAQRAESGGTGEATWRLLKQPMDLPDVPRYTGAGTEFAEGLMYPNKPGGAAVSMTYRIKETPDVVIHWYEDALKNYQWKTKTSGNGAHSIVTGQHGGNNITVTVTPAKSRGFRTECRISYKLSNK